MLHRFNQRWCCCTQFIVVKILIPFNKIVNGSVDTTVAYPAEIGHIDFVFTRMFFYRGVTVSPIFYDEVDVIVEKGIIHAERLKDFFFRKFSQTHTAYILGDQCKESVSSIAVVKFGFRFHDEW